MQPTQKYDAIISVINMDAIYYEVCKRSRLGAATELNYAAMIISIYIRYVDSTPTIKNADQVIVLGKDKVIQTGEFHRHSKEKQSVFKQAIL